MPIIPTTRPKSPYSKVSNPVSRLLKKVKGEPEDETMSVDMKNDGCSWKEIYAAFPDRTPQTLHVRCSTKLRSRLA
jgi:hypothetical protein